MTNLPAAVQYTGAAAYENQLYVYGGQSAAGTTGSNAVYTAPILPDGNLGSWTTLAQALPRPFLPTPACSTTATSTPLVVTAAAPCGRLPTTPKLSRRGNIQLDDSQQIVCHCAAI